jgi:hypothetical protein
MCRVHSLFPSLAYTQESLSLRNICALCSGAVRGVALAVTKTGRQASSTTFYKSFYKSGLRPLVSRGSKAKRIYYNRIKLSNQIPEKLVPATCQFYISFK